MLQEREKINYEIRLQTLECEKLAEEMKNNISETRVQAELVHQLPEVAAAIKIDNYSAFDTSGASPLITTIAQILNIFDRTKTAQLFSNPAEKANENQ